MLQNQPIDIIYWDKQQSKYIIKPYKKQRSPIEMIQRPTSSRHLPTQYLFLINGIACLLGYNALLTSLDYFNYAYPGRDVYTLFLPPVFAGYVLIAITFKLISDRLGYGLLIIIGIILSNLALATLLIVSLITHQHKAQGFYISIAACFVLGVGSNIFQLTIFSMVNYLSQAVVSKTTIGTALGGLGLTSLRMIIVGIAGTDNSNSTPIIIYFIIAILFNMLTLFCNISFLRSREYRLKILPFLPTPSNSQQVPMHSFDQKPQQQRSYAKLLFLTSKNIFPYPFIIFSNYVITFLVFPNLAINKKFQGDDFVWTSLGFLLAYNIGDTLGKFVCDYRQTFNSLSLIYMFISRAYFIVVIPLLATQLLDHDKLVNNYFYPYFVQFLFSLTNGIVTNGSFIQSYEICPLKYKKYAGVLDNIMLQIGILVGTNLAIPFSGLFISQ